LKNQLELSSTQLNLKNEELFSKNKTIDELKNTIDELKNIEIKRLEKIIDELQKENARLLTVISELENKLEKQQNQLDRQQSIIDQLVIDMEANKLEKQKLEEASLISDIYHQLYKEFLLKNKDDDDIKNYIKVKTNGRNKTSLKVYLADFHATMRDRNEVSARIKLKFNNAINKNSSANLLSYENNYIIYSEICEPRNIACHSSIQDSNFDSKNDYLHKIESKIKIMQHHKTYGEQLFKQLQNIIVIFNYRYKHNTLHYLYKIIFI